MKEPWYDKYNEVIAQFACLFPADHPCREILYYHGKEAVTMIAKHYKEVGMKKGEADRLRSMILNWIK